MKISDLNETDDGLLQKLIVKFRNTTGTFKNASHKFYSVRKALSNELSGDEQEAIQKVSPGEFFNYQRSLKPKTNNSVEKPPTTKPEPIRELRGVTADELSQLGTVYAVINKWVSDYHPTYSADEIADVLFKSELGRYEDYPYIAKEVRSSIIGIQRSTKEKEDAMVRPNLEKFKPSKEELEKLKASTIHTAILKDIKNKVDNQALQPGEKPQSARKLFGYLRNQLTLQYDAGALRAFKEGQVDAAKEFIIKREIIKTLKSNEFVNWYIDNKEA